MAFDITEFRAQMQGDGARPNLFQIIMPFPALVGPGASQKMTFMARSSQLPGSTLGMAPLFYFGREVKLAGNRLFPEWITTILNDEDFAVRRALEVWMDGMNSHAGNIRDPQFRNSFGYSVDAQVHQFAKTGEISKKYRFIGLWPTDVSPIDLDWAANDTVEEYQVTWQFQYWESDTTT